MWIPGHPGWFPNSSVTNREQEITKPLLFHSHLWGLTLNSLISGNTLQSPSQVSRTPGGVMWEEPRYQANPCNPMSLLDLGKVVWPTRLPRVCVICSFPSMCPLTQRTQRLATKTEKKLHNRAKSPGVPMAQLYTWPKQTLLRRRQLMFVPLLAVRAPHEMNLGEHSRKAAGVLRTLVPLEDPPPRPALCSRLFIRSTKP